MLNIEKSILSYGYFTNATFEGEHESAQRIFINPKKMANYYHNWHELYQEILDVALLK